MTMLLNANGFQKLTQYKGKPAISLFIPTARAGKEVHNDKNKTQLKSQWDQVKRESGIEKFSKDHLEKFDSQIESLLTDDEFWHHQSDGLAVYLGDDFFEYYRVPINFDPKHYILEAFYLTPLVPVFSSESPFYLLTLQLHDVHLYEANEYSIQEIGVDDLAPSRLEDRVGYDYKEKTLQHKNMSDGQGEAQYHGHGGGERNDEAEIKNFFSAVDKGLRDFLNDKKAPLVIMSEENFEPIYRETNTYAHLSETAIHKNPADFKLLELHNEAAKAMEDYFKQVKRQKMELYEEKGPETKSAVVHDIVQAAHEGRIDTLFLQNDSEVWGRYNREKMTVDIHDSRKPESESLMNLTAKKVLENDGQVFLLKKAFMPEKASAVNAVFRY